MLSALWSRFYQWIIGASLALAAIAAIYLRGKSSGKQVEQKKATQRDLTEAKQHAETIRENSIVQAEISRLPADDVRERLRKFTRD